ncbi:MAG: hypothetical protein CSB55_04170 [Candidatus Cloacimonadota bacterium]|nr:MAG: hypothetical protein CSB55_04170 [Candidatus Cloacimonadota bacterium]
MFQKKSFWLIFSLMFILSVIFVLKNFRVVMPVIDLKISMDRIEALDKSRKIAFELGIGPDNYKDVAVFEHSGSIQNYIELDGGGVDSYKKLLQSDYFFPYFWKVRHFNPGQKHEALFYYSPDGKKIGFEEKLSEDLLLPEISEEEALALAEKSFGEWNLKFSDYELIEKSKSISLSGRVDRFYTYEHKTRDFKEARFRQKVSVSGNKLTGFSQKTEIPESFFTRYKEMRSLNNLIAQFAQVGLAVLYGLGGILFGIFFLMKQNYILWKRGVIAAFIVALAGFAAGFNYMPVSWIYYRTELSESAFVIQMIMSNLVQFIVQFIYLSLTFIAAESLTRKAFPNHVRFWDVWGKKSGSTTHVLGNTLAGYMTSALSLVYILGFYFITKKYFHWWNPASIGTDPNTIATLFPWFSAIATALHAGFWEECLFRAVPIASAVLIGRKLGKEKLWLGIGLAVQALIFAAGHANYPAQPYYARLVELIIPSMYFAYLYMRHGLLTGIIMHFTFDAVLMSFPIWIVSGSKVLTWRIMFVAFLFIPLWIILIRRLQTGKWSQITEEEKNGTWIPEKSKENEPDTAVSDASYNIVTAKIISVAGIISFIILVFIIPYASDSDVLTVTGEEAILRAKDVLKAQGTELDDTWKTQSSVLNENTYQEKFIYNEFGANNYTALKNKFLPGTSRSVAFVKFSENAEERSEKYKFVIGNNGIVKSFNYHLPEKVGVQDYGKEVALEKAIMALEDFYHLKSSDLTEKEYIPRKLPGRIEHKFTFKDTVNFNLPKGELNYTVTVIGDKPFEIKKEVFAPENWKREFKAKTVLTELFVYAMGLFKFLLWIVGIIFAVIFFSKGKFNKRIFILSFFFLAAVNILSEILAAPETFSDFNTAVPLGRQIISSVAQLSLSIVFKSGFASLILGWFFAEKSSKRKNFGVITDMEAGLIMTNIFYLGLKFIPSTEPALTDISEFAGYMPVLEGILLSVSAYFSYLVPFAVAVKTVEYISDNWTKRINLTVFTVFLMSFFLCGNIMLKSPGINVYLIWTVLSLIFGIFSVFILKNYIRYSKYSVLMIVAVPVMLKIMLKGYYNLYPGAIVSSSASIIVISVIIYFIGKITWKEV